jgi:hypothetical protein
MRVVLLFRCSVGPQPHPGPHFRWIFLSVWIFLAVLATASTAEADGRVPPPRPEVDAGPPPLPRAPEHARRPVELASELALSLPTCQSGAEAERCAALAPALGAGLAALYRQNPYFAFGAGVSFSRASSAYAGGVLDGETFAVGAVGRVYLYEEGAFDPYLELELGYGSLRTTLVGAGGARYEDAAFGPTARVGGGLDFVVMPSLELGAALGFSHLLLERGEECARGRCTAGSAPSGAMVGALVLGLRATVLLGKPL